MSEYTISPGSVNMSVIPSAERARLDQFIAAATARRQHTAADAIPATPYPLPGRIKWYILDGPRYDGAYQPITVQARGECGQLVFAFVPYTFNADLRSILARYYRGRWQVRITSSNARRIAAWLAWWDVLVDEAALDLLRLAVQS